MGLLYGPEAYLSNGWNVLDGLIVVSSFIALLAETIPQLASLRSLPE